MIDDTRDHYVLDVTENGFPAGGFKGPYPRDEALKIADATNGIAAKRVKVNDHAKPETGFRSAKDYLAERGYLSETG